MVLKSKEMDGARQCTGSPSRGKDMIGEAMKSGKSSAKDRGTSNKNVRMIRGR